MGPPCAANTFGCLLCLGDNCPHLDKFKQIVGRLLAAPTAALTGFNSVTNKPTIFPKDSVLRGGCNSLGSSGFDAKYHMNKPCWYCTVMLSLRQASVFCQMSLVTSRVLQPAWDAYELMSLFLNEPGGSGKHL